MKILMVTPYPPVRDGIAAYAVQTVARLRADGHHVETLSPAPSAAHHHLHLVGPRGALALAKRVRRYDRVIVQFHPDFFYPTGSEGLSRAIESSALATAFRLARDLEVVVHEVDYSRGRRLGPAALAERVLWRSADRIVVHTEVERADMAKSFGVPIARVDVGAHGADFIKRVSMTRQEARAHFGLPADGHMFLSIGFIQPHKGFDRAVRAFSGMGAAGCRLDVVGSVRVEEEQYLDYLDELRDLVDSVPGAHLHEEFVSDTDFDRWLVAADTVVLPYRFIWSSSVFERAALYERPIIATRVGGLADQGAERPGITIVDDDAGLAAALRGATGELVPAAHDAGWAAVRDGGRDEVMAAVRDRARLQRGGPVMARAVAPAGSGARSDRSIAATSAPLRRLNSLVLPAPTSGRSSATAVKKVVRRLTGWMIDPVVVHVNRLQEATVQAVEQLATRDQQDHTEDQ